MLKELFMNSSIQAIKLMFDRLFTYPLEVMRGNSQMTLARAPCIWGKIVSMLFILLSCQQSQAKTVTLANGEWAPFQSEFMEHHGFISRVVTEAFAQEGYQVQYSFLPWKRGFEMAKIGSIDGTFIWGFLPEREPYFYFSDLVISLSTSVFHHKNTKLIWNTNKDFGNYRVAGILGYDYGMAELEEAGEVKIMRTNSLESNIKMLEVNRIDAFFEDTDVGLYYINKLGLSKNLKVSDSPLNASEDYYLLISKSVKNGKALIDAFNRGLKKLKAAGKIKDYQEQSRKNSQ